MKKALSALLALILMLAAASVSFSEEENIFTGRWTPDPEAMNARIAKLAGDYGMTPEEVWKLIGEYHAFYTFTGDGTVTMDIAEGDTKVFVKGTYKVEGDTLTLEFTEGDLNMLAEGPVILTWSCENGKLTLSNAKADISNTLIRMEE